MKTQSETKAKADQIWIIQTAFIGDCVLSLPFLYRLLESQPQAELHVISTPGNIQIFELAARRGLSWVQHRLHFHRFDKKNKEKTYLGVWKFAKQLVKNYGIPKKVYCLQRSFRSALLAYFSESTERVGFSSGAASFLYTNALPREWHTGKTEIDKNLSLLENDSTWSPVMAPSLLKSEPQVEVKKTGPVVGISLGSPWPTKRWPVQNAAELVRELVEKGVSVQLLGDASTRHLGEELRSIFDSVLIEDLSGKTNIEEWVDAISKLDVLVSGDSAAVHVASDLNVPVLALFGPTLPEFGFAPWRKNAIALGQQQLYCRPCHIHGPKVCPEKHHRCMKEISAQTVVQYLRKSMAGL